jgi:hypothetical protein
MPPSSEEERCMPSFTKLKDYKLEIEKDLQFLILPYERLVPEDVSENRETRPEDEVKLHFSFFDIL